MNRFKRVYLLAFCSPLTACINRFPFDVCFFFSLYVRCRCGIVQQSTCDVLCVCIVVASNSAEEFAHMCNRLVKRKYDKELNERLITTTRFTYNFIYFGLMWTDTLTHARPTQTHCLFSQTCVFFSIPHRSGVFFFISQLEPYRRFCLGHLFAEPTTLQEEFFDGIFFICGSYDNKRLDFL